MKANELNIGINKMIKTIIDFYNKEVNNILDMRMDAKPGWNKDFLTNGQIATYVDSLGLSEGKRTEVYITLKDFFFNHLDEYQNLLLGVPGNVDIPLEQRNKNAIMFLQKLYGDK